MGICLPCVSTSSYSKLLNISWESSIWASPSYSVPYITDHISDYSMSDPCIKVRSATRAEIRPNMKWNRTFNVNLCSKLWNIWKPGPTNDQIPLICLYQSHLQNSLVYPKTLSSCRIDNFDLKKIVILFFFMNEVEIVPNLSTRPFCSWWMTLSFREVSISWQLFIKISLKMFKPNF